MPRAAIRAHSRQSCRAVSTLISASRLCLLLSCRRWRGLIQNSHFIRTTRCSRSKGKWMHTSSTKSNRIWISRFSRCRSRTSTPINLRISSYSLTWRTTIRFRKATSLLWASSDNKKRSRCDRPGEKWNQRLWLSSYHCPLVISTPNQKGKHDITNSLLARSNFNSSKSWSSKRSRLIIFTSIESTMHLPQKSLTKCKTC